MSIFLEKQALNSILGIKSSLLGNNIASTPPVKKDYNYEITALAGSEKCKILVFFGKKGIKTILQGNADSGLYKQVDSIVFNKLPINIVEEELSEPDEYIGTDESGKGDIFGPLVVAAVYVNSSIAKELLKIGVRDSKEIKNGKISSLASQIETITKGNFSVTVLAPPDYNRYYSHFGNLNKLLDHAHSDTIKTLLSKVDSPVVITDQFCRNKLTISKDPKYSAVKFIQFPKGERYIGVAAASILARNYFELWFAEMEEKGILLPKGASNDVSIYAGEILAKSGKEILLNLSKNHFKPIKDLLSK